MDLTCPRYQKQGLISRNADQALLSFSTVPQLLARNRKEPWLNCWEHHDSGCSRPWTADNRSLFQRRNRPVLERRRRKGPKETQKLVTPLTDDDLRAVIAHPG